MLLWNFLLFFFLDKESDTGSGRHLWLKYFVILDSVWDDHIIFWTFLARELPIYQLYHWHPLLSFCPLWPQAQRRGESDIHAMDANLKRRLCRIPTIFLFLASFTGATCRWPGLWRSLHLWTPHIKVKFKNGGKPTPGNSDDLLLFPNGGRGGLLHIICALIKGF